MTEKESYIINLVMGEAILRRIAWHKWTSRETIPDEVFLYLVESWVVHSELGLDHDLSVDPSALERALAEEGIPFEKEGETLRVTLGNCRFGLHVGTNGTVVFSNSFGGVGVSLSARAIPCLARFADAVLPEAVEMVLQCALKIEQGELATTFASRVLRSKLDELGALYEVKEYCDYLKVEIFLFPNGKIRFSFVPEKVDSIVNGLESTIAAAKAIFQTHGIDLDFCPLELWDRWAEPFNREV